jgi:hypothetical protein
MTLRTQHWGEYLGLSGKKTGENCIMNFIILYFLLQIINVIISRRRKWAWHAACIGTLGKAHQILLGQSERKRPIGRPWCRWEHNMKVDHKMVGILTGFIWFRTGTSGRLLWTQKSPGSVKGGYIRWLAERLLKRNTVPWNKAVMKVTTY